MKTDHHRYWQACRSGKTGGMEPPSKTKHRDIAAKNGPRRRLPHGQNHRGLDLGYFLIEMALAGLFPGWHRVPAHLEVRISPHLSDRHRLAPALWPASSSRAGHLPLCQKSMFQDLQDAGNPPLSAVEPPIFRVPRSAFSCLPPENRLNSAANF